MKRNIDKKKSLGAISPNEKKKKNVVNSKKIQRK